MEKVIVDKYKKEVADVLSKVSEGLAESVIDRTNNKTEKVISEISILNDLIKRDLVNNENFYNNLKRNVANANFKISDIEVSVKLSKNYLEESFQNFSDVVLNIEEVKNKFEILNTNNSETARDLSRVLNMLELINQNYINKEDVKLIIKNQQNMKKANYILIILLLFVLISSYVL